MKKLFLSVIMALLVVPVAQAQQFLVEGRIGDSDSGEGMMYATAAILKKDNTVLRSAMTDSLGNFSISTAATGDYRLRLSYIGYQTKYVPLKLQEGTDTISLGSILLDSDEKTFNTAVVTATAARVQQNGDTTQFNAEAYRVPEGSTIEALIKQLPGVEVSDDGTIKWNGKQVKEFLINGKDFFKGDTKTAMKNLPTEMISRVKAYDKKSDYTEQTGIDDGEETTVMDLMTKRELNQSWLTNADIAYGNHKRYSGRFFITRFTDNSRITLLGSANNTGDRGFGGPRGFGGSLGLTASKMLGADFTWDNGKKKREAGRFEIGGNVRYNHTSTDLLSTSTSQMFLTSGANGSYSNSRTGSFSHSTDVQANLRLQWSPDSMTFVTFRPQFSHNDSHNSGNSQSATFSDNPYSIEGMNSPLDSILAHSANAELQNIFVNSNVRQTASRSNTNTFGGSLNVVRRIGVLGRNVSLRGNFNYSDAHTSNFAISDINYNAASGRPGKFMNQYTFTPNKSLNYSLRLGYVEPLGKNWFAEARYEFSYRFQDSNRSLYNLSDLDTDYYGSSEYHPVIGSHPTEADILQTIRDDYNSQYAKYKYYNNNVNIGIRYNSSTIRFNAGVSFNPQHTKMQYERPGQGIDTLITRNVLNISPEVRFRYRFTRTNQLDIRYRGSASQPTMTNLLDVVDDSDPLNISMGNPGLKPSWQDNFRAIYNGYDTERQAGMSARLDFSSTRNAISTRIVYDEKTGTQYSRPENISGIWNINGGFMYNFGFGPEKLFTLTTNTNIGYTHDVGYVSRLENSSGSLIRKYTQHYYGPMRAGSGASYSDYADVFKNNPSVKNAVKTVNVGENLNLNYRATYFDVGVFGTLNYQNSRNTVQTTGNLDTWNFSYGVQANATAPWGTSLSTDIRMSSRRGYADHAMNTNEVLWNAQISQSFLENKALTVSIQFYDILHQRSNVSRVINAQMRRDTWSNAINSYFMVHLIYRLSIFGGNSSKGGEGKEGRGERGGREGDFGGMGGRPGGMGERPSGMGAPGGMGGGRF